MPSIHASTASRNAAPKPFDTDSIVVVCLGNLHLGFQLNDDVHGCACRLMLALTCSHDAPSLGLSR